MTSYPFAPQARFSVPVATVALLLITACGRKAEDAQTSVADTTPIVAVPDTVSPGVGHDMSGMAMTGDPDRDFLRMMGDHHMGLVAMARKSMESQRGTPGSRADASRLDAKQGTEVEQMRKMLQTTYQDSYEPKVMPTDQAVVDALPEQSGAAYATQFYRGVVAHHRRAIAMIDEYLATAKRPDVKAMAERMRTDQLVEIEEFEKKSGG